MRILFDRNVEPKYISAIAAIQNVTVEHVDDRLPQTANDSEIVSLADRGNWVVFTRDDDFFSACSWAGYWIAVLLETSFHHSRYDRHVCRVDQGRVSVSV